MNNTVTGAIFSDDRVYRYSLWRKWSLLDRNSRSLIFIGLNPSTANENKDDPTIRRCVGFAKREGFGGMVMLNLFAYISTNPDDMTLQFDSIGPDNDQTIKSFDGCGNKFVACWGHWDFAERIVTVMRMITQPIYCLGVTQKGSPRHPLYLKSDAELIPWRAV
jgi:hypothetical protein